jgi:peptide/nickel transport system substrate-binding protein
LTAKPPLVSVLVLVLVGSACSGRRTEAKRTPTPNASFARGGTLRVRAVTFGLSDAQVLKTPHGTYDLTLDPGWFGFNSFELFRCCLLRTLLSYSGQPTERGGAELRPDLATGMPTVSADGLAWTFRIKPGIHYGPPLQAVEVTAQDFVRAIQRELHPSPPGLEDMIGPHPGSIANIYIQEIEGARAFADGNAQTISGLETPDPHTLVVRLTEPTGDLGHVFSLAATSPVPPRATDGHDATYGRYLVALGPYMFEGSEKLDFSVPPADQKPVSGYVPEKAITLVRNPSWDPSTDPLRKAYVDRIEIAIGGSLTPDQVPGQVDEAAREVEEGRLDVVMDVDAPQRQILEFRADASRSGRVFSIPNDVVEYMSINVAQPPFDDLHVRKAVSYAIERDRIASLAPGKLLFHGATGVPTGHAVPDSLENNLLLGYDPYPPDFEKAKREMAQSTYDANGDGICDAAVCKKASAVSRTDIPFFALQADVVRHDLEQIGIRLSIEKFDNGSEMYRKGGDPKSRTGMILGLAYVKDFPNASSFFRSLLAANAIGFENGSNFSLVGATPQELKSWGYSTTSVPSLDAKINECVPLTGSSQTRCWAELDQLALETVVPYVPYLVADTVRVVSARVANFSFDQFADLPALDQIALKPGA